MPDAVPTLMEGAAMLMSMQGAEGVRYILLAPLSTMSVSVLGSLISPVLRSWGWGLQRKQQTEESLVFPKKLKLALLCVMTAVPPYQVQKASQPLFKYCAGPSKFSWVAVSTCPGFRSGQL